MLTAETGACLPVGRDSVTDNLLVSHSQISVTPTRGVCLLTTTSLRLSHPLVSRQQKQNCLKGSLIFVDAETGGFEPPEPGKGLTSLAKRHIRPL